MNKAKFNFSKRRFNYFLNVFLATLQNYDWPAKHRFFVWFNQYYPSHLIEHKVNSNPFLVPVDEWCFWLEKGPNNYYLDEFLPFFDVINRIERSITFFDLGADIGTVSAIADKHCNHLKQIFAFEPNAQSFALLSENLNHIPKDVLCQNVAISDFDGTASFTASPSRSIDHEGSIDTSIEGATQVVTLDTWLTSRKVDICPDVAIKIDVEGQEAQAIVGAQKVIENAKSVVILLEIHPEVLQATNTTPEMLFETLESIRKVKWLVPILGNCNIDRRQGFFNQFPIKQYDVIAILD